MARQNKLKHENSDNNEHKISDPHKKLQQILKELSLLTESDNDSGFESSRSQSLESVRSCVEKEREVKEFQKFFLKNQTRDTNKLFLNPQQNG